MIRMPLAAAAAIVATLALAGCVGQKNPVATVQVVHETYKIELTTPELAEHAQELLDGKDVAGIPNGKVVRDDASVNAPWSWHIDPATLEFADQTTEVCDGLPSYVEDGTVTSEYYCPWSAKIIAIDR
jgi:hypothetical protein